MPKLSPKIIVLSGYGLNCEEETALAFELSGGTADIVHINDLIAAPKILSRYQILAIPGGFSYGDDLGSGKAYANKLRNHLQKYLNDFTSKDKLVIGICNGFQILTNLGLLPGVLTFNDNNRYTDRWVDVKMAPSQAIQSAPSRPSAAESRGPEHSSDWIPDSFSDALKTSGMTNTVSPWLRGITSLSLPIAHGEGKFVAADDIIKSIKQQHQIAGVYYKGEVCRYQSLIPNPNGSLLDIAMLTSANGKILGTMPHPERGIFFTQTPDWPLEKEKLIRSGKSLPEYTQALRIFKNAINYFL
jgi:phosphoribosylformylglycinamidine (FGAM) synthase-like amidotransferase family enzyme